MSEDQPQPQPPASGPGVPPQQGMPGAQGAPQPAYGYPQQAPPPGYPQPQQAPPPGYPQQPGPGYPPPQGGGYAYPPPSPQAYGQGHQMPGQQPFEGRYGASTFQGDAEAPDWSAMASQHEDERRKRKRNMVVLSAVGGLLVVGGIVAGAVLLTSQDKPADPIVAGPSASTSGSASPSASSSSSANGGKPTTAEGALSKGSTDKAPISLDALFPNNTLTVDGQVLTKVATEHGDQCASGTVNGLGKVLEAQNCKDIYLATYQSDKAAVTVGVVVFDSKNAADTAQAKVVGNIKPLRSDKGPRFCPDLSQCAFSNKAFGRYMVFTTAGNADMSPVTDGTPATKSAAAGVSKQALDDLKARGQAALTNAG
ncbi:hypothetical protein ACFV4P_21300 [Kitasatospora sp. NPDC059795]|uniref:hypothetical protein n=1 Tax=Kitasatospora sp. NPDC059795 TaxID=3346949 RepID=UPI003658B314